MMADGRLAFAVPAWFLLRRRPPSADIRLSRVVTGSGLNHPSRGVAQTRIVNRMKATLIRFGIRNFNGHCGRSAARTGRRAARPTTMAGIIGNVMTYEQNGKQYVAVLSGVGGWPAPDWQPV
jgi:hypothetical protein